MSLEAASDGSSRRMIVKYRTRLIGLPNIFFGEIMTENKMGIDPINRLILGMSWPAMLSMFINAIYSIVDSIFVSYLGEDALVAVTLVLPVQLMLVAFGVGTGVGINSVIARKLGEKYIYRTFYH